MTTTAPARCGGLSRQGAARGPFQHLKHEHCCGRPAGVWPVHLRLRRVGHHTCRTLEQEGVLDAGSLAEQTRDQLLYSSMGGSGGGDFVGAVSTVGSGANGNGAAHSVGSGTRAIEQTANQAFKQLRQAVLTSLDFADNAEQTMDYEDGNYDYIDEINLEAGASSAVGLTVYETLRIDAQGKTRRVYVRRRDLIRAHGLQPRDLRRVDPSLGPTKTSASVTIKEECLLVNIGGVKAIITADRCLLFEPGSAASRKFVEAVAPRIHASAAARLQQDTYRAAGMYDNREGGEAEERIFPFELEMIEGALMVATGKLEAELVAATRRVSATLQKLPREITPVNLEELRRVKQMLVELESKAENLRDLLEELMDDEEELLELNLSSRPKREEKRRQRERDRLEREIEKQEQLEHEKQEQLGHEKQEHEHSDPASASSGLQQRQQRQAGERRGSMASAASARILAPADPPLAAPTPELLGESMSAPQDSTAAPEASTSGSNSVPSTNGSSGSSSSRNGSNRADRLAQLRERERGRSEERERDRERDRDRDDDDGYMDAQDALEEMIEEEEAERELEEVEDLLEYYLQRAATTQSEAARLLAGARDLEESIGVSLSARRFEVNRLELLLSIASFAAALGAMVASIFGMNLRSTLEMSVIGFWGTTFAIIAGSCWIFWVLYKYTKRKRIL